jgi:predicted RND superfamily exporter protein
VLTAAAVPGITMLDAETGYNTLVSSHSQIFQDNARYEEQFGGEPITVLITGQLEDIFSADNLAILGEFEQDISQDPHYLSTLSPFTVIPNGSNASISPEMSSLIPDDHHALIIVTPVGNMDDEEALLAADNIENFFSANPLVDNVHTTVIADAKVIKAIGTSIGNNMAILLALSVSVMVLILFVLFYSSTTAIRRRSLKVAR